MAKALVVEDDDGAMPAIQDALEARRDAFKRAKSLEEGRRLFQAGGYDYVLLDLKIPAREGGAFPDMSYGIALLKEIRQTKGKEATPVIAMTSYHSDGFGLASELHALGVTECVSKPFDGKRPLVKVIEAVLLGAAPARPVGSTVPTPAALEPFSAAKREMVIYEDRITVCGAEVWHECGQAQTRDALALLSRKEQDAFVRIRGTKLTKDVGREATNHIGKPLADLCQRISEVMAEKGIDCGREDVIRNKAGGYHFREWMVVCIVGNWAEALGIKAEAPHAGRAAESAPKPAEPAEKPLNERQQWILSQIDRGEQLTLKGVLAHFRSQVNRSTINRDLKELRDRKIIKTEVDGTYIRVGTSAARDRTIARPV